MALLFLIVSFPPYIHSGQVINSSLAVKVKVERMPFGKGIGDSTPSIFTRCGKGLRRLKSLLFYPIKGVKICIVYYRNSKNAATRAGQRD